jgi:hypothetical protein
MERERIDVESMVENGLALRTIGWMLLIFDAVFAVWIWTGLRAGSWFWFGWVLIQGFVGIVSLGAGVYKRSRVAQLALTGSTDRIERVKHYAAPEEAERPRAA